MKERLVCIIWIATYILQLQAKNDLDDNYLSQLNRSNVRIRDAIKIYPNELQQKSKFPVNLKKLKKYKIWSAPLPSIGLPLPKANIYFIRKEYIGLSVETKFILKKADCDIPKDAINRYYNRIIRDKLITHAKVSELNHKFSICLFEAGCHITKIEIIIKRCSYAEIPYEGMNEHYKITIQRKKIRIQAIESWGILRGLETLAQMAIYLIDYQSIVIQESSISDSPKRKHRGLMLDTSRHFIPINKIFENLDAMEMNKMNVFHWHLTDDQSFPFKGPSHPELAINGAFDETMIYDSVSIESVVEYARLRGIRVIPELDVPGHVLSMIKSYPGLATNCKDRKYSNLESINSLSIIMDEAFDLLQNLYSDLFQLFPDDYVHIGFDEIDSDCMKQEAVILQYMKQRNLTHVLQVVGVFIYRLQNFIKSKMYNKKMIAWQEAIDHYKNFLHKDTVIQVYYNKRDMEYYFSVANRPLINSYQFYLDRLRTGLSWYIFYQTKYLNHNYRNYIGAEACMWTEYHSAETITHIIWPTTSGLAEILWTKENDDIEDIGMRIEEQRCRMLRRGIPVGVASGPGTCKYFEEHVFNMSVTFLRIAHRQKSVKYKILTQLILFYIGAFIGFYFCNKPKIMFVKVVFVTILIYSKLKYENLLIVSYS